MRKATTENELNLLKDNIIKGMQDKKAYSITSIDLSKLSNRLANLFIICHGTSDKQVDAIAESVEHEVFLATGEKALHREGFENKEWILLDYFDIIVHIFVEDKREFFALENLWGDGEIEMHE